MYLGGDYHDRDNPHKWGVSQGQFIVFITLVCNQKEGRQQSSSRRGLQTSVAEDDYLMMMMMMMMIFYRGTGTKCTEHKIIVTRNPIIAATMRANPNNNNTNKRPMNSLTSPTARPRTDHQGGTRGRAPSSGLMLQRGKDADDDDDDTESWRRRQWQQQDDNNGATIGVEGNRSTNNNNNHSSKQDGVRTGTSRPRPPMATDDDDAGNTNTTTRRTTSNDEHSREDEDDVDDGEMPSATGTLDRKTSQASPKACLYTNQHKMTREA
jgi:hypothetical protein